MRSIPHVSLYGDPSPAGGVDLVHCERIPERSSLFNWEIEPHVHDAMLQVLYVEKGGGEAVIGDRRWVLEPPCLVVVPALCVHGFRFRRDIDGPVVTAAQRPLETLLDALAPELRRHVREPAVLSVDRRGRHRAALVPLFDAIAREMRTSGVGQAAAGACAPPRNRRSMFGSASSSSAGLVQHQAARLQRDRIVGHLQRALDVLLDHQHGHALLVGQPAQQAEHVLPPPAATDRWRARRSAAPWGAAAAPGPLQLLLLAAGQRRAMRCAALLDAREETPALRGCARGWSSCPA
jgi:hypothetical protein